MRSRLDALHRAFAGGPRFGFVLWTVVGIGFAGWGAAASAAGSRLLHALAYLLVAAALTLLAAAIVHGARPAEVLAALGGAGGVLGAPAAAIELAAGVDPGKAQELRALGVDPRLGVALNVAYFAAGAGLAAWLLARIATRPGGGRRP